MSNEIPDTDPAREVRNMVRHIILWKLKESFSEEEKAAVKAGIKEGLESLQGKIPGLLSIEVHTEGLASSTCDLMLESAFVDESAYKGYKTHPEHLKVANGKVRPNVEERLCLDFQA